MKEDPTTASEVIALMKYVRESGHFAGGETVGMTKEWTFTSYLVSQCGANPVALKKLIEPLWPEAARLIEVTRHQALRGVLERYGNNRRDVVNHLEALWKHGEFEQNFTDQILEEWDARHFPSQVPEAIRERALWRHRRAMALFPDIEAPVQ